MTRSLKIEEQILTHPGLGHFVRSRSVSAIRLKGKWLAHAGFPSGERVELTVLSPGVLQLKLQVAPEPDAAFETAIDNLSSVIKRFDIP